MVCSFYFLHTHKNHMIDLLPIIFHLKKAFGILVFCRQSRV